MLRNQAGNNVRRNSKQRFGAGGGGPRQHLAPAMHHLHAVAALEPQQRNAFVADAFIERHGLAEFPVEFVKIGLRDVQDRGAGARGLRQRKDLRPEPIAALVVLDDQGVRAQTHEIAVNCAPRHIEVRGNLRHEPSRPLLREQQKNIDCAIGG